jgi:hypothetical protein
LGVTTGSDIFIHRDPPEQVEVNKERTARLVKKRRLDKERKTIEGMYCPCPGFAYNSLAGERNVLVSYYGHCIARMS